MLWTTDVIGGWFAHNRLIRPTTCEVETTMAMSMVDPLDQWWLLGVKMVKIGRKIPYHVLIFTLVIKNEM
jgi:hypothetical protein